MANIRETVAVAAPPQQVWDTLVDFETRPRWSPRVKEAAILGGGPLKEGSRIRLKVDRDRFTSTVLELRPPEQLTLLVKGPGFRVTHMYGLRSSGAETQVTMTGDYRGLIGALVSRFMSRSLRRDLTGELDAIKRAAESGI